jgi:hypothetical protein
LDEGVAAVFFMLVEG